MRYVSSVMILIAFVVALSGCGRIPGLGDDLATDDGQELSNEIVFINSYHGAGSD